MIMRERFFKLKWSFYKPQVSAAFDCLMRSQFISEDEREHQNEVARQKLVRHAYENTLFYRDFYGREGFEVGDIGKSGWFEKLPVLTKSYIRTEFERMFDPCQRKFAAFSMTGGSTGVPTRTGHDKRLPIEAWSWRFLNWYGVQPWDDHAYVWRRRKVSVASDLFNAALWWPTRHLKLDATLMDENDIVNFLNHFNRLKPKLLQGYVGAITQLAQFVIDKRWKVHYPHCVWTTSAPLSMVQRSIISKAFGAPILDQYGSCEVDSIAQSCPQCKGLHVNSELVYLEYVDESGCPLAIGDYGRALLTNLQDTVFPIIRYENGDRGRYLDGKCACGRTLPIIDAVKGRESESFILPSGKVLNGEYLTTIFDSHPEIVDAFRVVQHKDLSIDVRYVPHNSDADVTCCVQSLIDRVSGEVPVRVCPVDRIENDKGKIRFIVRET